MAVLGMRGTGNFTSVERPQNFRQAIGLLYPNGDAPLTAFLSRMKEEATDDPQFHWFEKGLPLQSANVIGAATTNPPASGDDIGTASTADCYLLVKPTGASSNDASIFKPGHVIRNQTSGENLLVLAVDTTNNTIKCRRDIGNVNATNPAITGDSSAGDEIVIVGSGFPEGAPIGTSIGYAPTRYYNFTQIYRTPLSITRTARKTRLRTDDSGPYREAKREAGQIHAVEMEKSFLYGEREEITSLSGPASPLDSTSSGQPLRLTRGMVNWLPTATTSSVSVHTNLTSYNSGALTETIWEAFLESVFRYGSKEKLAFCGSTALMALNAMAKNKGVINLSPGERVYGFKLMECQTPFGTLMLYNHPLLTENSTWRKDLFVIDLDKIRYRYIDDTQFLKNRQSPGDDCTKDEFLTEAGLEVQFNGTTPDNSSPNTIATQCAHGRMSGIASYAG